MTPQQTAVLAVLIDMDVLAGDDEQAQRIALRCVEAVAADGEAQENVAEVLDAEGLLLADSDHARSVGARVVDVVMFGDES